MALIFWSKFWINCNRWKVKALKVLTLHILIIIFKCSNCSIYTSHHQVFEFLALGIPGASGSWGAIQTPSVFYSVLSILFILVFFFNFNSTLKLRKYKYIYNYKFNMHYQRHKLIVKFKIYYSNYCTSRSFVGVFVWIPKRNILEMNM